MRRPALSTSGLVAAGVICGHHLSIPIEGLAVACAGLLIAGCLTHLFRKSRWCAACLVLLIPSAASLRMEAATELLPPHHIVRLQGRDVILTGVVGEEPQPESDRVRFRMRATAADVGGMNYAATGDIQVGSRRFRDGSPPSIAYGDTVVVRVQLERPSPARNPGAFDYRSYLERKGIYVQGFVRDRGDIIAIRRPIGGDLWVRTVLPLRRRIRRTIDANLAGGPGGLLKGMLLGEKRGVPDEVRAAFARCGVNHVLAVSGLHVGLIGAVVFFGTRLLGLGQRPSVATTVCALAAYACVTGLPPSVIRASVMAAAVLSGKLIYRDADGLNTLGAAAVLLLSLQPTALYDLGFQLSFAATGAILTLHRPVRSLIPIGGAGWASTWIAGPLSVSVAAQLGTAPLVAATFGQVAVISPIANLVVVPIVGAAAGLGLLTVLLSPVGDLLTPFLNGCNWAMLRLAIAAAEQFARPDWATLTASAPSIEFTAAYVSGLLLIVPGIRKSLGGRILLPACILAANLWVWHPVVVRADSVELLLLDVGQGDCLFVTFPNGRTMLVDGGLRAKGMDSGEKVIAPFLRRRGISRIDVVVASHPHSDHVGGLVHILETFDVGTYVDSGQYYESWTARRIRSLLKERRIRHEAVAAGDSLVGFGRAGLLVLHPSPAWVSTGGEAPDGLNNGSVVLRLTYEGQAVLLTGDVEHETDGDLIRWGARLQAQVLKAAHHGSRTSSSTAFLKAVDPSVVAISCGVRNKFKHPSPEVVDRYRSAGLQVYRSDHSGAIRFSIGRGGISVKTWLGEP